MRRGIASRHATRTATLRRKSSTGSRTLAIGKRWSSTGVTCRRRSERTSAATSACAPSVQPERTGMQASSGDSIVHEAGSARRMARARPRRLFVSWAPFCSRSDNIARELGGSSAMIYHGFWGSRYITVVFKYLTQTVATLWLLLRKRPHCVLVMSPPSIAALPVWLYSLVTGRPYFIDAHTAAFAHWRWRALGFVQRFFARRARTTIVTNDHWAATLRAWGARCEIVQDVPVLFPEPARIALPAGFNVAVVSTFTFDEPTAAMFAA